MAARRHPTTAPGESSPTEQEREDAVRRARRAATAASQEIVHLQLPEWLRVLGIGAWMIVGIAVLGGLVLLLLARVTPLLVPLILAAVLAAVLVPVVDRLQVWHVPRWLGAALVLIVALALVVAVAALVVAVLVDQGADIWQDVTSGLEAAGAQVDASGSRGAALSGVLQSAMRTLLVGWLGSAITSVAAVLVGVVLGTFMLLFLLKDWEPLTTWASHHVALPARLAEDVMLGTVHAFRGYALGLTVLGVANALIVGLGALALDVPHPGAIALVSFIASYVPYFGACVAGAFAVIVALGAHGLPVALAMLAIVLLANNTIQNLLEPFAFGRSLRLHPLVVLITTTAGTLLFGLMGAIVAAPLTSAFLNAVRLLRDAGLFDDPASSGEQPAAARSPGSGVVPAPSAERP
jgi:predicted PurR-regulated permease PerM